MTDKITSKNIFLIAISCLLFALLGIRGYGYYIDDQTPFLFFAQRLIDHGSLSGIGSGQAIYGNGHPPLLTLLLALFTGLTNILIAPVVVQLLSSMATIFILLRICSRRKEGIDLYKGPIPLVVLFFLVPFTHQSFLFVDIDNTLLPVWGALFILGSLDRGTSHIRHYAKMGLLLSLGLWCKLTTPLIVFGVWALFDCFSRPGIRTCAGVLFSAALGALLFLGTYLPFCMFYNLPVWYPVEMTFAKGVGWASGFFTLKERCAVSLRSLYIDLHFFSAILFFIAIVKTAKDLQGFKPDREHLAGVFPMILFWAVYLSYTLFIPTIWLPRYKFALLPFFIWWLSGDFTRFFGQVKLSQFAVWTGIGIASVFILPDLGTSAFNYKFYFHSFSLVKPFFEGVSFYPVCITSIMHSLETWSSGHLWGLPIQAFHFVFYFMTWVGFAVIILTLLAACIINAKRKNILHSLFILAIVLWTNRFVQDMDREYELFYCAGTTGFKEMVAEVQQRIGPEATYIGNKDFAVYTKNNFVFLNDFGDQERAIDIARLHHEIKKNKIRYLAFLNRGEALSAKAFTTFLLDNCTLEAVRGDYLLYSVKSHF